MTISALLLWFVDYSTQYTVCRLLYCTIFLSSQLLLYVFPRHMNFMVRHSETSPWSPLISNLSLPLLYFYLSSFATQKRAGARKSKLSELPKRNESYKGDVTLNKSPHHGMTHIYTTPEGIGSSDVSLSVFLSLPHSVFLSAAT